MTGSTHLCSHYSLSVFWTQPGSGPEPAARVLVRAGERTPPFCLPVDSSLGFGAVVDRRASLSLSLRTPPNPAPRVSRSASPGGTKRKLGGGGFSLFLKSSALLLFDGF